MRFIKKATSLLCIAALTLSMTVTAFATNIETGFSDVPADSLWAEGVAYARENNIVVGDGNGNFMPDAQVTLYQLAIMLCRAYNVDMTERGPVSTGHDQGWYDLSTSGYTENMPMTRGAFYSILFNAADIMVFDPTLYHQEEESMSVDYSIWGMNLVAAKEFGLCAEDASVNDPVTRGEAVATLMKVKTAEYKQTPPPIFTEYTIFVADGYDINLYLHELEKIPVEVKERYNQLGWTFKVDPSEIARYNQENNFNAIGLIVYSQDAIYCVSPASVVHEFGHFLMWTLKSDDTIAALFEAEGNAVKDVISEYATTNKKEFFADYFEHWIYSKDNPEKREVVKAVSPKTHAFFETLEANGWSIPANTD